MYKKISLLTGSTSTFGSDYFFSFGDVNRPTAAFFDPISFGNVLALGIPIALALALALRAPLLRLASAGCAALMATALILTLSRMSWVGAAAGVLATIVVLPGRLRLVTAAGTAIVVAGVIAVAVGMEGTDIVDRAQSLANPTSSRASTTADTDRGRVRIWEATIDVFEANPVSGVGLGNLGDELVGRVGFGSGATGHAHSVYLQTLATAGVLGALALLLLAWEVARRTIRTLRAPVLGALDRERRILASGIAGALVALAVACATDTTPRYQQVAGIIAIVVVIWAHGAVGIF